MTYVYKCAVGHEFEAIQRITDKPLEKCIRCKNACKRKPSATNFILKGPGWGSGQG